MTANFKPNDLVWAKVKGFPTWPGIIADVDELSEDLLAKIKVGKNSFVVYFPDSKDHSAVPENSIFEYAQNRDKYIKTKKQTKKFKDAVEHIENLYKKLIGEDSVSLPGPNEVISPRTSTPRPKVAEKTLNVESHIQPDKAPEATGSDKHNPPIDTQKTQNNSQQWPNTSRTKDYTRLPFGARKRASSSIIDLKPTPQLEVKKTKPEESVQDVAKTETSHGGGNIGVLGSGLLFESVVRNIAKTKPVIYLSKKRITGDAWAAHFKTEAKDVLQNCRYIFCHFKTVEEAHEMFLGQNNKPFYNGLTEDKFVINLTPFNIKLSKQIDSNVSKTGATYLEACMFLTHPDDFRNAKFPMIVAGDNYQNVREAIHRLSSNVHYVGEEIGNAFTIVNGLTAINVGCSAILREVSSVLNSNHIDLNIFNEILQSSPLSSASMSTSMGLIRMDRSGHDIPAVHSSMNNRNEVHHSLMKILEAGTSTASPLLLTGIITQLIKK